MRYGKGRDNYDVHELWSGCNHFRPGAEQSRHPAPNVQDHDDTMTFTSGSFELCMLYDVVAVEIAKYNSGFVAAFGRLRP